MFKPADRTFALIRHHDDVVAERSEVRAAVKRFLLMGLVALVVVTAPAAFYIRAQAETHALAEAERLTQHLADYAIAPLMTQELLAGDPAALAAMDEFLAPRMIRGPIMRVKVWDAEGRIVYSDVSSLIGQQFVLPVWGTDLLTNGGGRATLAHQIELENEHENDAGALVEAYVKTNAVNGQPLIFEAYYVEDGVRAEQHDVLLSVAPALLLSLVVLQMLQLIPAVRLAKRIQAYQRTRRNLLRRAIEASDLERQRIARDLHDDVIQDLAGLSYAMEAEELRSGDAQRPLFTQARGILQDNVRILRTMTNELYPPNLDELGLPGALGQLTDPLVERGIEVKLHMPERCDLDRERSAMFYRVAREVLRNTAKHAKATTIELSLHRDKENTVLQISDDGCGFDAAAGPPEGHLGLKIMRDTIHEAGGALEVRSGIGNGTSVVVTLRTPGRLSDSLAGRTGKSI